MVVWVISGDGVGAGDGIPGRVVYRYGRWLIRVEREECSPQ